MTPASMHYIVRMRRTTRIAAAWLAMLAMLMHALWPLAAAARPRADLLDGGICTASGFLTIQNHETPASQPAAHDGLICVQCGLCASPLSHGAAPAADFVFASPACAAELADRDADGVALPSPFCVPGARPRAPPLLLPM